MKTFSSKRRVAAMAALVLLALFLFRPGASRLKSRIISSLGNALGRSVDLSSVHVRLLPRPGFDLENLGSARQLMALLRVPSRAMAAAE